MITERIPQISELTIEERMLLAEELWESVSRQPERLSLSPEHLALLEKRWRAFESGESTSRWEDVRGRLFQR